MADRRISFVSLGCPKALVDSEHIVTELESRGYDVVDEETSSTAVVINTCGFVDAAKDESFATIQRAVDSGKRVVVTGCLGADAAALKLRFPMLEHISGPRDVGKVLDAVQTYVPGEDTGAPATGAERAAGGGTRLTPEHYAYLKISEGCNHGCTFCIIPDMRGPLHSRGADEIVREAEGLRDSGVQEVMLVAQDLSAYGVDLRYADGAKLQGLCERIADVIPWVRLHYVYPYPSVDGLVDLMADGKVLPYLDVPLQHASPRVLKAMRRPAAAERTLERIRRWREKCPDLCIRSTFIVGFPGETSEDVGLLLDFLAEAKLDRVGFFTYSAVEGARANALPDHIAESDKLDRQEMVYELQAGISSARLERHVGRELRVLIDSVDDGAVEARSMYDAPEIDGIVRVASPTNLTPGEFVWVRVDSHDDHDLDATFVGRGVELR